MDMKIEAQEIKLSFAEQYRHPSWQKNRLEILDRGVKDIKEGCAQ